MGMKLIWGNRNHDNLENTFRTMRPVRPVNTKINLRISLRCLYELLWPLCFSRSFSECMLFFIKANTGVFRRCLSPSSWWQFFVFFFFFFWFGFYGPFKNISLISSRSFIEGGRKPENPEKTTWPSVSRTWLSHIWPERGSNHSGEKPNGLMTIQMSEWVFYVQLTVRSWRDGGLGLKSHMKDWRSLGSNSWPCMGYKASSFTTTPPTPRHPFLICHTVKYFINGSQILHHALPLY